MKIQNINNCISYKTNSKPVKYDGIKNSKYDMIEINKNTIRNSGSDQIEKIKKGIVDQIDKGIDDGRLNKIRNRVKNGTYEVDVDEIVRILLDK